MIVGQMFAHLVLMLFNDVIAWPLLHLVHLSVLRAPPTVLTLHSILLQAILLVLQLNPLAEVNVHLLLFGRQLLPLEATILHHG